MKKNNLKSILSLAIMSFLFIAFAPNDIFAQRKAVARKVKNKKVVTPVSKQYAKQPRRGAQITKLPRKTTIVSYRNANYHYRNGIFYRPINGTYIVAAPPRGIRISVLPPNAHRIVIQGRSPYYYYYGTYYSPVSSGGYEVIDAPIGARVDALPDGYDVFELDGLVYYRLGDTYYKAVLEPNGNVIYEVVRV